MSRPIKPPWLRFSRVKSVVYHATNAPGFVSFDTSRSDLGAHFGTLAQANYVAEHRRDGEGARIIPVWLNLRSPLRLKDVGSFHADGIAPQLERRGLLPRGDGKRIVREIDADWKARRKYDPMLRQIIEKAGYDGVVYKNAHEGAGDSYIAFHPAQIKSAIGNRGTFDPGDPVTTNPRVSLRAMPRLSPAARRQLARGTRVEMEHTGDRKAARLIAAQHLAESPRYYAALAKMEKGLRPNPPIPYEAPNLAGMRVLTGFRPARQLHHHTCGPACLRAVLAWNSIEVTEAALAKQANTTKKHGTKPEDMVLTLQDYGRRARLCLNADVNWCLRQLRRDCPVLILWNDWHGHWVVLIGYDPKTKRLLFADPANPKNGLRVHSLDTLRRNWTVKVAGTKYKRLAISVA